MCFRLKVAECLFFTSSFSFLSTSGCWAGPSPANRHRSEGGHPRCHARRERWSGSDCHLCGHLNLPSSFRQSKTLHHSLTSVSGTRVVDKQLDKQSYQKAFFFLSNWCYWWITEKHFSVPLFPKKTYLLPSRCGTVETFTKIWKDYDIPQNPLLSFRWFSSPEGLEPTAEYKGGLLSVQGGCCFFRPLSPDTWALNLFTSTLKK